MATPPKAKWCRRLVNANFVSRVSNGALDSANRTDQTDQAVIFGQNAGITTANAGKLTASLQNSKRNTIQSLVAERAGFEPAEDARYGCVLL
jgi:hypothetical protein